MQNSPAVFPENSLDWRFLLPITSESKILVIGRGCGHIQRYLMNLGLSEVFYCTGHVPQVSDLGDNSPQSNILTYSELGMKPQLLSFFDIVVYPNGLSDNEAESLEIISFIKKYIRPGGALFISFANELFSRKTTSGYSYLWQIKKILKKTGYAIREIYGAIPDQHVPEYVFPLTPRAIGFIVRHRYAHKVPNLLLRLMASPFAAVLFSNFFPAYFVAATVAI